MSLRRRLMSLAPEHDTPAGLLHPYWARKPFNIVREVIRALSKPGQVVADPFMGSGTTVLAALAERRHVVASDLNPLAVFVVTNTLRLASDTSAKLAAMDQFIGGYREAVLPWFAHGRDGYYIERERFKVTGEYRNGRFEITPQEVVLKLRGQGGWHGRKVLRSGGRAQRASPNSDLLADPIDFTRCRLESNSRIAIPVGATLAHYYTPYNRASINLSLRMIMDESHDRSIKDLLRFLLSSALPLLRLSDRKASSQWPYWRPRESLTSRNPVLVLEQRVRAFKGAADWLANTIGEITLNPSRSAPRSDALKASIRRLPAQQAAKRLAAPGSVDLVVTDPPYADQAPYLEYSALWASLLGFGDVRAAYPFEIVKTNAPARRHDSRDYARRLASGLAACADLVKPGGFLALFYHDHSVAHWTAVSNVARDHSLSICDVIALPKQRRSMKTVTSPGRTLDGDLLLVFQKLPSTKGNRARVGPSQETIAKARKSVEKEKGRLHKFAALIKSALQQDMFAVLSNGSRDLRHVLRDL